MKKLKLFAVALMACFSMGAMAVEPDFESYDWDEAGVSAVVGTHDGITISSEGLGNVGNVGGHYYIPINTNLKNSDSQWKYFGVTAGSQIDSISVLYCPNGSNSTNIAWVAWGENVEPNQYVLGHGLTTGTTSSKSWDNAVWETINLSEIEAYTVYISRSIREFREIGATSNMSNFGAGQTINVLGIRVWLHSGAAAPTYTVTYKANGGVGEDVVAENAKKVAANTFEAPDGKIFDGWNTAADGTGTAYDAGDALSADVTLYAQWVEIVACAEIIPASEGAALNVGDEVELDAYSEGGKIFVAGMKTAGTSIAYTSSGLQLGGGGADSIRIELNNYLQVGSIIQLKILAGGTSERGLNILTTAKKSVFAAKWTPEANGEEKIFTYVVTANDGLAGANKFLLQRNNSVYLAGVIVSACGSTVPGIEVDNTPSLKAGKEEVNLNVTAENANPTATVVFSGKNLAAGNYALTVPNVAGLSVEPASVTVGENGKLNATVTLTYASDVDVDAATAEIKLTIGELEAAVAINYSAVHAKVYMTSVNFEQQILTNGLKVNRDLLLAAANIAAVNIDALDSLNDEKANRNYPYLGLKMKKEDARLSGWLTQGSTVKVRFGNVGADFKVAVNGAEQTLSADDYANATVDDANELVYTASDADAYIEIICGSTKTLVVKQIMIDEDIQAVVLPESPVNPETAIDDVNAEVGAVKFVENGQIYILKNGVRYNALGAAVK